MARLKISVKFSFLFIVCFVLLFDENYISFFSLIASVIHESAHILTLLLLDRCNIKVTLKLMGLSIHAPERNPRHEWIFLLSGPLTNFLMTLFYPFSPVFGAVNLCVGIINLLPISFTDGGRLLSVLLRKNLSSSAAARVELIVSSVFLILIFAAGLFITLSNPYNFTILILIVYLSIAVISGKVLD